MPPLYAAGKALGFNETQVEVIIKELEDEFFANISAIAYGPGQDTLNPEIIAQRLAALVAIVYNDAAKFLLEKTGLTKDAIICKEKLMANYEAKKPSNTQSFFQKESSNRLLRKLAAELKYAKTRSAEPQCTLVHEDSSNESTKYFNFAVEFPKKSNIDSKQENDPGFEFKHNPETMQNP